MRAGLDAAGWNCVLAIDNDPDAVAVHQLAHGDARLADVTALSSDELPSVDAWVAGFPCQPFSSSGSRLGFGHHAGNVFEHIARLAVECRPPVLLLENVEGLLTNKSGHTMAVILATLASMGYAVSWLLMNLRWFGVPQTRARLFIVASQPGVLNIPSLSDRRGLLPGLDDPRTNAFGELLVAMGVSWRERCRGALSDSVRDLRPAVGKAMPTADYIFGPLGSCEDDRFWSFDVARTNVACAPTTLGAVVAPSFSKPAIIRSLRFWTTDSGRGPTRLWIRSDPVAHCIGTSLGGAPLFGVPLASVRSADERRAFLEYANWHREQDGLLIMRLRPGRAVQLFGPHTEGLHKAVTEWKAGDTRKYRIVGNMVAPVCAKATAQLINAQMATITKSEVQGPMLAVDEQGTARSDA
jgi:site-specific DNA-cytosine methylase